MANASIVSWQAVHRWMFFHPCVLCYHVFTVKLSEPDPNGEGDAVVSCKGEACYQTWKEGQRCVHAFHFSLL